MSSTAAPEASLLGLALTQAALLALGAGAWLWVRPRLKRAEQLQVEAALLIQDPRDGGR